MATPLIETPSSAPALSIVIPVYNRRDMIGAALRSLAAAGRDDVEIIVVDDGSADDSAEVAEATIAEEGLGATARVLRQPNGGPGAARNTGAAEARGRYLAFFDSDDRWFPWTLDLCLQALADHGEAQLVFLRTVAFQRETGVEEPPREALVTKTHTRFLDAVEADWALTYGSCNVIIRRDLFDRLGGFTHDIRCAEDTDLFLRADPAGLCLLVMAPAMLAREMGQDDSLTANVGCVVQGLDYLIAKEGRGAYPEGAGRDPQRTLLLAAAVISTVRLCFASGHPALAYARLLRYAGVLFRGQRGGHFPRLFLTPVLQFVRPERYRFRLRPS